jgi:hypothetical protein
LASGRAGFVSTGVTQDVRQGKEIVSVEGEWFSAAPKAAQGRVLSAGLSPGRSCIPWLDAQRLSAAAHTVAHVQAGAPARTLPHQTAFSCRWGSHRDQT